jgi:hypothetical protein
MKNFRKNKGTSQNLYLIETIPESEKNQREFVVMGSTGNVYNVTIKDIPQCTCPDFRLRHKRCKHIYFVLIRLMKTTNEDEIFDEADLKIMFNNIPKITSNLIADKKIREVYKKMADPSDGLVVDEKLDFENIKNIDDNCPICLDGLNNGQELDNCKSSCGKYIHRICFIMWCKKNNSTCVFCRSDWHKKIGANEKVEGVGYFNYINVLKK